MYTFSTNIAYLFVCQSTMIVHTVYPIELKGIVHCKVHKVQTKSLKKNDFRIMIAK